MGEEHYFTADPSTPFKRMPVSAHVWGHWLELTSGSGVFAQGRLDTGTGVLLREAAPPVTAREVLDLGCGYGVIGLAVAVAVPEATVTAVDVNERALVLAHENAEQLGVADRFRAVLPDEVEPDATYDEIWSNPPIRVGQGGPARPAPPVAAPAATRWPGADGGRQEPRLGLARLVARGPGLPHREARQCQGLPGAGDAPRLTASAPPTQSPAIALRISLTASAAKARAHRAIATLDTILLRHSRGVRSVFRIQSRVTARNGMKKAPSTP